MPAGCVSAMEEARTGVDAPASRCRRIIAALFAGLPEPSTRSSGTRRRGTAFTLRPITRMNGPYDTSGGRRGFLHPRRPPLRKDPPMSASSSTARSVGLTLGSALAVAAILVAAFTAFSGSPETSDSKQPGPHTAPTAAGSPGPSDLSEAPATPSTAPTCNLFDAECLEEYPGSAASLGQDDDGGTGVRPGETPRVPAPQGTAATGGGGVFGGSG